MLGKIEEYYNGKVYARSAFCGQPPEILVTHRVELERPRASRETQKVHFDLLTKWSLRFATPWFELENDTPGHGEV